MKVNIVNKDKNFGIDKYSKMISDCVSAGFPREDGIINIVFVDKNEIRKINSSRRGKNKETDVITFSFYNDKRVEDIRDDREIADVFISAKVVEQNADSDGVSFVSELKKVIVHSIVHIKGYDHESDDEEIKMKKKEKEIVKRLNQQCG